MAEITNNMPDPSCQFKEAVCIDAGRVYDSCCDRDCLEDLRCCFTEKDQAIICSAKNIRVKSAEVLDVNIDVEPVNFNRGFYSCDLTFYFLITFDVFTGGSCPDEVRGIATHSKKVILYGSEGNVRIFSNADTRVGCRDKQAKRTTNMPKCVVQSVDPIVLSSRICDVRDCFSARCIPHYISEIVGGNVITELSPGTPTVYVTLGLFTVVQLIRNVQMLVPVYDFCIPEKQCNDSTDQPCDVFKKIKFPTDDFFPPRPYGIDGDGSNCGCMGDTSSEE